MKGLFFFGALILTRIKNRIIISLYNKPEFMFIFILLFTILLFFIKSASSMLNIKINMSILLFPKVSYIFIFSGLLPFILFYVRNQSEDQQEEDLLLFIGKRYFKFFKHLFFYLGPFILSYLLLSMVLSIYKNISMVYSLLFWEVIIQIFFIIAFY